MTTKKPVQPSARIEGKPTETTTDSNGRQITFRRLTVLDTARLMRAVGAEHANNTGFLGLATVAAMVTEIDGVPQPQPRNLVQVDAAIERLGDEGFKAIAEAMGIGTDPDEEADVLAAAKN
jgi:hypothetical protein